LEVKEKGGGSVFDIHGLLDKEPSRLREICLSERRVQLFPVGNGEEREGPAFKARSLVNIESMDAGEEGGSAYRKPLVSMSGTG